MGCDIHCRAEVRDAESGEWRIVGDAFDYPHDWAHRDATREYLESLTDAQLLAALEGEARWYEHDYENDDQPIVSRRGNPPEAGDFYEIGGEYEIEYEADGGRKTAAGHLVGVDGGDVVLEAEVGRVRVPVASVKKRRSRRAFWTSLPDEARAALADAHERELEIATRIKEFRESQKGHWDYEGVVAPGERRIRAEGRVGVELEPAVREALIRCADEYRNPLYKEEDEGRLYLSWERAEGDPPHKTAEPYEGRNYNLFAILANVRNGGRRDEPQRVQPLSDPRGVPEDASSEWKAWVEDWGVDGHSHTYFTLAELQAAPWHDRHVHDWMFVLEEDYLVYRDAGGGKAGYDAMMAAGDSMFIGFAHASNTLHFRPGAYERWVELGRPKIGVPDGRSWVDPNPWIDLRLLNALVADAVPERPAGETALSAGHGRLVETEGANAIETFMATSRPTGQIVVEKDEREPRVAVLVEWEEDYAEAAGKQWARTMEQLAELVPPDGSAEDVRFLAFFDN